MKTNKNKEIIFSLSKSILLILPLKIRFFLGYTVILAILSAIFDSISTVSIIPAITFIFNSEKIYSNDVYDFLLDNFQNLNQNQIVVLLFSVVLFLTFLANILKILFIKSSSYITAQIGVNIGNKIYSNYLSKPYSAHSDTSTAKTLNLLTESLNRCCSWIDAVMLMISGLFSTSLLLITLSIINFKATVITLFVLLLFYISVGLKFRTALYNNGNKIIKGNKIIIGTIKESFASIKNIIIDSKQNFFANNFRNAIKAYRFKNAQSRVITLFPRQILETIILSVLALIAFILFKTQDNTSGIPAIIGSIAFGLQKLLPAIQTLYTSWAGAKNRQSGAYNIVQFFNENKKFDSSLKLYKGNSNINNIKFRNLKLNKISFCYPRNNLNVLKDINLSFYAGQKFAILGKSGCGKSTLLDILMCLIKPTNGQILINEQDIYANKKTATKKISSWMNIISLVSQEIFLLDGSIEQNIIMDSKKAKINQDNFKLAVKVAELDPFVRNFREKYKTLVGENGKLLSGGQRQRIVLARAIYKNPQILFLDEATNALDSETEKKIIDNIFKYLPNITLVMVTHKTSIAERFDKNFKISNGEIQVI